jgi:hypothetical protein
MVGPQMNKISLCINSFNPNHNLLMKAINTSVGFDEKIIAIQYGGVATNTAAEGFNSVISKANTDWICPFCDDDFFHIDNLKSLLTWFHDNNIDNDIVYFPIFCGNDEKGWTEQSLLVPSYEVIRQQNMLPFSCFIRKSLWEKVGGYENVPFNDWYFYLKALKSGAKLFRWEKPIYYFRVGNQESLSNRERKLQNFDEIRQQLLDRLESYEV